jgi:hypothetical protein
VTKYLRASCLLAATCLAPAHALFASPATVYTGAEVVAYEPGAGVWSSLTAPEAAVGLPSASSGTGPSDGNFSPFNPHYRPGEIVQVGAGGNLTVRLERFVRVTPQQRHLGVWENIFLVAASGGVVGSPPSVFGADSAIVEVSANGTDFVSLGPVNFSVFGNHWADSPGPYSKTPGTLRADFGRPFTGDLASLGGATYAEVLGFLDGTAGGTWIDLSPSGLDRVGWVRFSGVAAGMTLEIDAVTINTALAGEPTLVPRLLVLDPARPGHLVLDRSLPHARYQLEVSDNLALGWRKHGEAKFGTGAELDFTDHETPPRRFYRVVLP